MNRTALALALVTVAALLPWPSAQALSNDCVRQAADDAQQALNGLLGPHDLGAESCLAAPDCESLVSSLLSSRADPCTDGLCPDGDVGAIAAGSSVCLSPSVGIGDCPPGFVGKAVSGRPVCVPDPLEDCNLTMAASPFANGCPLNACAEAQASAACAIADSVSHPACPDRDDDWGFGGTMDTCYYACGPSEVLHIQVTAEDKDADAEGSTSCGGASADCPRTPVHCEGISAGLTKHAGSDQACFGRSYETWDSEIIVSCESLGVSLACQLTGYTCDVGATSASIRSTCLAQNPAELGVDIETLLANLTTEGGQVLGLIVVRHEPLGSSLPSMTLHYDAHGAAPFCDVSLA